jgi:hypothetical protein
METLYKSIDDDVLHCYDIPYFYKIHADTYFIKLKFLNHHYYILLSHRLNPSLYDTFYKVNETSSYDIWCDTKNNYLFNKVEQKWLSQIAKNMFIHYGLGNDINSMNCCRTAILNLDYKHVYQMMYLLFTQYNMLKDVFHYTLTIYKNYLCVDLKQYQLC